MNTFLLFVILLGSCAGYALLFGGACEAWAAGLQLAAFAAGWAIKAGLSLALPSSHHVATGLFAIDLVLLSALVLLAIRATRFWPLWIAGFHCASVVAHVAKLLNPGMVGYAVQIQLWGYPMLLVMAFGTWRHRQRLAQFGSDPSWKPRRGQAADDRLAQPGLLGG